VLKACAFCNNGLCSLFCFCIGVFNPFFSFGSNNNLNAVSVKLYDLKCASCDFVIQLECCQ